MKRIKKFLLPIMIAMLAVMGFVMAACGGKVTLSFVTGDGPAVASVKVEKGAEYTLPVPEWEGYAFEGWYLSEDCSGNSVASYTPTENTTFYAKWEKLYLVTLQLEGGTLSTTNLYLKAGANLNDALASYVPTKTDFQFGAWYNGNQEVTANTVMPASDITLTAHYKVKYTVQVYLQSLEDEEVYERADDYVDYAYATANFTPDCAPYGFTLGRHSGDVTTKTLSETNPADNVYVMYFDRDSITVIFDSNGVSSGTKSIVGKYGMEIELPADTFTRTGYLLIGWSKDYSGDDFIAVNHETYNGSSDASTKYTFEEDVILYAVWQKGYVDIFGGPDNIFVVGEKIYLLREGILFEGEHVSNNRYKFNSQLNGDILLDCRVYDNGTFCYANESRGKGQTFYKYDPMTRIPDENTRFIFDDPYNGISYIEIDASNHTSTKRGTYVVTNDGLTEITFTDGTVVTVAFSVQVDEDGEYVYIFMVRNDEEYNLGTLPVYAYDVENKRVAAMDDYSIALDGLGYATLKRGSQSATLYYMMFDYDAETKLLWLFATGDTPSSAGIYVITTIQGVMCVAPFNMYAYGKFTASGNRSLELDGTFNATYRGPEGVRTGYYYSLTTLSGSNVIAFVSGDEVRVFALVAGQEDNGGTFEEYSKGYGEYLYASNGVTDNLIIILGKIVGEFELYILQGSTQQLVMIATGTYSMEDDVVSAVITEHINGLTLDPIDGGKIDLNALSSFKFAVSIVQADNGTALPVMYWFSYVLDSDEPVDMEVTYDEVDQSGEPVAEGGELRIVNGFGYYTDADGELFVGLIVDVYETEGVEESYMYSYLIYNDGTLAFKLNKQNNTFARLDFELLGTAVYGVEDGAYTTLEMDGFGNATLTKADNTQIEGRVSYTGEITDTGLVSNGEDYGDKIYLFESDNLTFKFVLSSASDGTYYFLNETTGYAGSYSTTDGHTLMLDGYGLVAWYGASSLEYIGGYYVVEVEGDTVISFIAYSERGYTAFYFDVDDDTKTARMRGEEFAEGPMRVVLNQRTANVLYWFDGVMVDGKGVIKVYSASDSSLLVAQGYYFKDADGMFTIEYTDIENDSYVTTVKGMLGVAVIDSIQQIVFSIAYTEIAKVYINPVDWSIMRLDGRGTAYVTNSDGSSTIGYYSVIGENLIYLYTKDEDPDEGRTYVLDSRTTFHEVRPADLEITGYFTNDLDSLIFTALGTVVFQNELLCYYNVDENGVVTLYYAPSATTLQDGEEPNDYGYIERVLVGGFTNNLTFNDLSFKRSDGARITFTRGETGEDAKNYPIPTSTGKVSLGDLVFTPSGSSASYMVKGYVYFIVNDIPERRNCTISYEFNTTKEDSHYYLIFSSTGGGEFRYEIDIVYNGDTGSTYTVIGMRMTTTFYSGGLVGSGSSSSIGMITLTQEYDKNGDPIAEGVVIDAILGEYDHTGELIEIEGGECTASKESSRTYVAKFKIGDYDYSLTFDTYRYKTYSTYIVRYLTRTQKFENVSYDGKTCTVEIETLLATDLFEERIGTVWNATISYAEGGEESLIVFGAKNKALVFTQTGEEVNYAAAHIVITTVSEENTTEVEDLITPYASVTLTKVTSTVWNATDEDGMEFVVLFNGDEVEIFLLVEDGKVKGSYIIPEKTEKVSENSYDVTIDDTVYNVSKGDDGRATIIAKTEG